VRGKVLSFIVTMVVVKTSVNRYKATERSFERIKQLSIINVKILAVKSGVGEAIFSRKRSNKTIKTVVIIAFFISVFSKSKYPIIFFIKNRRVRENKNQLNANISCPVISFNENNE
jgi:hypothetical protein